MMIGLAAARVDRLDRADVISRVETTDNGDTLIHVGETPLVGRAGRTGWTTRLATVRLTPGDRDRLIDTLIWQRTTTAERLFAGGTA